MEKILIAKVNKPHGVRGELRITSMSDFVKERFVPGKMLYFEVDGKTEEYVLKKIRPQNERFLITLEGIENVNEVDHLRHADILIDYDELHDLPKGQYYFIDLIGLDVFVDDQKIGVVKEMFDLPAHPVMNVSTDERDIMIPYVDRFILSVDLEAKRINVDWMEGL